MANNGKFSKIIIKVRDVKNNRTNKIFDHWEKKPLLVNFLFALIPVILYYLGYLGNIRENTGTILTYLGALITLNGVFLTLLVTLKGSPIFERLKKKFPVLHDHLFIGLKRQLRSCVYFSLINLLIAIAGPIDSIWIAAVGIIIWSYFLAEVSFGIIYTLKVVTDLALKDVEGKKPMS